MLLHENQDTFEDLIALTAEHFGMRDIFIEKDYWLTKALKNIFESDIAGSVVFKGGTSLSKCFELVDRFSEDVDLAITPNPELSGNQQQKLLRRTEKIASEGLVSAGTIAQEMGLARESKGSRFRKTWWQYPRIELSNQWGQAHPFLLLEINAFADPTPVTVETVNSYIAKFLTKTGQEEAVEEFGLQSFQVNVLSMRRTLAEKIMGLIKVAYEEDPVGELGKKIRHVYDLHQLVTLGQGIDDWIGSEDFMEMLRAVHVNDQTVHGGNADWCDRPLSEASVFSEFDKYWSKLDGVWNNEFRSLLHHETLPDSQQIKEVFARLHQCLIEYDAAKLA